jgi:RNA polymerase sigma-70 factor (ECF subfamily)
MEEDSEEAEIPDEKSDVLGGVLSRETSAMVRDILECLSERDRRILREVFLEERDKDEVCRDFGVGRDYLRVLLHRAKQEFKSQYMKSIGEDPAGNAVQAD